MIKHRIKEIIHAYFNTDDDTVAEVAAEICAAIEDDLMTGIRTAVQVRIHGIPA